MKDITDIFQAAKLYLDWLVDQDKIDNINPSTIIMAVSGDGIIVVDVDENHSPIPETNQSLPFALQGIIEHILDTDDSLSLTINTDEICLMRSDTCLCSVESNSDLRIPLLRLLLL